MSPTTPHPAAVKTVEAVESNWRRVLSGSWVPVTIVTILLFAVSPVVVPGSLAPAPILSMLPIASFLAIASAGQTLVVQQRGLDMSVPGMLALGAILTTGLPQMYHWPWGLALVVGILACGVFGIVNGILVTYFRVMSLVATLGINSVLLGIVSWFASGTPSSAGDDLHALASGNVIGIPNMLIIAVVIVIVAGLLTRESIIGHRLTAVGISERAARALGIRVNLHKILAYAFAGICYGIAGALYAGFQQTPELFFGDDYLLPTVAVVVLGGTALTGGLASVVSTGIAALFLSQLQQLVKGIDPVPALQYIVEAIVLIVVVLLREIIPMIARAARARRLHHQAAVTIATR